MRPTRTSPDEATRTERTSTGGGAGSAATGTATTAAPDEAQLTEFVRHLIDDLGGLLSSALVVTGYRLGLYEAMADSGWLTSDQLADATATNERYVREWLAAQAAAGYIEYDRDGHYALSAVQAEALANPESPVFLPGGFLAMFAAVRSEPAMEQRFRTGEGLRWDEQDPDHFAGIEHFFGAGYAANLVSNWVPALDGVEARLRNGCRVADIGCGHGASTLLLAQAFPASTFIGFDFHPDSVATAAARAEEAEVADRVVFEVATAKDFPGSDFGLVTFFNCLHDMGDPVGALVHARTSLSPSGSVMLVEPFAADDTADNMNPIGQCFYAASTLVCTPCSLSQEVGLALGSQAGEARLRAVADEAGFDMRRAAETPFSFVFDLRPRL